MSMVDEIQKIQISQRFDLRELLLEDFKIDYPICGGWGYEISSPIVFTRNKMSLPLVQYRNFISLEWQIALHRTYEELIVFRQPGDRFNQIELKLVEQAMSTTKNARIEKLNFQISCIHDTDFEKLKLDWDSIAQIPSAEEAEIRRGMNIVDKEFATLKYERDFWFDITDPFSVVYG